MSFSSNWIPTWVCCLAGRHLWSCRRRHTLPLSGRILLCCAQTLNMVAFMNIEYLCSAHVQPLTPQNLWWKVGSPSLKLSFSHVYWNYHSDITCTLHPVSGVTPSSVTITLYQIDSKYHRYVPILHSFTLGKHPSADSAADTSNCQLWRSLGAIV